MTTLDHDDYGARLSGIYAEQLQGMRDGLLAVNRNVLIYIAEGRERAREQHEQGKQLTAAIKQLGVCAVELGHIKAWGRIQSGVIAVLLIGVIALLIKVF